MDKRREGGDPGPPAYEQPDPEECWREYRRYSLHGVLITVLGSMLSGQDARGDRMFHAMIERHLQHALDTAIRIGNDTDTVAATAGGLLGARWGASAVPWSWRRAVHGWPRQGCSPEDRPSDARELMSLGTLAARDGRADPKGWPTVEDVRYREHVATEVVAVSRRKQARVVVAKVAAALSAAA